MANEITALVQAEAGRGLVSVHGAVGEDGQGMIYLKKNAVQKGVKDTLLRRCGPNAVLVFPPLLIFPQTGVGSGA